MRLAHLTVRDVRTYADLDFAPQAGLNVIVGENGQGKSNLLEAVGLLATGKSFRTSRERELIRNAGNEAYVAGETLVRAGVVRLACSVIQTPNGTRKTYAVNGRPVRYASYLGRTRVVTFVPADLDLVTGPPSRRRSLLNLTLSQESSAYYAALAAYTADLGHKNAALRGLVPFDAELLATYDERLVQSGSVVIGARRAYVETLAPAVHAAYANIAGAADGPLEVHYAPNVEADAFAERLVATRGAERARKTSLVGPHRDDLSLVLAGRALGAYGSQGQQRSAVLALKTAEYAVLAERSGEAPLLLLDDVLSELDPARQAAFLRAIGGVEQAFVTATVAPAGLDAAATYRVAAAQLERIA